MIKFAAITVHSKEVNIDFSRVFVKKVTALFGGNRCKQFQLNLFGEIRGWS
jgi:hypothetical protein